MVNKTIKIKILNHIWTIRFLTRKMMHDENNGTCWILHKIIEICDDLSKEEASFILTHELVHAFMGMSGRAFEGDIPQESVCETVAWHIDEIIKVRNQILKERYSK